MKLQTLMGSFNVRTFGQQGAPAVILLHPLASSGDIWRPFAGWLAQRNWRVFAPDLPGEMPPPITIKSMADAVAAIIRALELEPVSVVGMSMGGCVAQQLTLDHPSLVGRLVLADTTSNYGDNRVRRWEERARAAMTPDRRSLREFQIGRWFSEGFQQSDPAECERVFGIFVDVPASNHAACCRALGNFDATGRIGEIAVPTLVLVGEGDYATPVAMARTLANEIAGAQLVILPGVSHFAMVESREAWWAAERHLAADRNR